MRTKSIDWPVGWAAIIMGWAACVVALAATVGLAAPNTPPLIQAVRNKDIASVRTLLKQRVDVNAAQGDGATALHWAAHVDHLAIADLLIRAGARANAA